VLAALLPAFLLPALLVGLAASAAAVLIVATLLP
jgi:hypothetical protein